MAGARYPKEIKLKVLRLGKTGKTYPEIQTLFPIPKSTLSYWFKNAGKKPDRMRQLEHLKRIRLLSAETKRRQRQEWINLAWENGSTAAAQLNLNNKEILMAMLSMLYWAEGAKHAKAHGMAFVNTDPQLMLLYITLLRKIYPIDEARFRVRLHLHYYHSHKDAIAFWSKMLDIPPSQFGKIYVKKRSKQKRFRKNFQGICFVKYPNSVAREEVLSFGRAVVNRFEKSSRR